MSASRPSQGGHWLFKADPEVFGLEHLARAPGATTSWDGIRNAEARNHMRDGMHNGDLAFLYHSNATPKAIVGIVEIVRAGYPDPDDAKWCRVDVKLVRRLERPVTLDEVKRTRSLASMALVKKGRLSVQPVTPAEWETVLALARKPVPRSGARSSPRGARL